VDWLAGRADGHERVVLGVCAAAGDADARQVGLRRLGLDPAAVELVDLGREVGAASDRSAATSRAALRLAAAAARAGAFRGTRPDSLRPVLAWEQSLSRRSLFTLPPVTYRLVPSVRPDDCAAPDGCRACVPACPHGALAHGGDGAMAVDGARCTACGACVSACPRTALDLPGCSPPEIDAEVRALLDGDAQTRDVVFVCERLAAAPAASEPDADGWLPVRVPCAGMVTPGWLLASLALGAARAAVRPCGRHDCRFGQPDVVEDRVAYCRQMLAALDEAPERVHLFPPAGGGAPGRPAPPRRAFLPQPREVTLFTPAATARALLALASARGRRDAPAVEHARSPFGLVEVGAGCTTCGACVQACPTGALGLEREADGAALAFDAARCIGCAECVPVCPERVLTMRKVTDVDRLGRGRVPLRRSAEVRCQACAGPVAPRAMLERILARLGDHPAATAIARYCPTCRGGVFPGAPAGA
jgi:ferredoxin